MKSIALYLTVLAGIALLVLGSCTQPLGGATTNGPDTDRSPGALLAIRVPTIGRALRSLTESTPALLTKIELDPAPGARAIMVVDGVNLYIYDATDELVGSATIDVGDLWSTYVDVADLPSGGGFYAEAEVFNTDVSVTVPVSTGTSDPFDIVPGQVTYASIAVVPNPAVVTSLSDGVASPLSHTASVFDSTTYEFTSLGGEEWFSFVPTESSIRVTVTPNATSVPLFSVFDATGLDVGVTYNTGLVAYPQVYGGDAELIVSATPGETCYIGAMLFGATASTQTGSITVDDYSITVDAAEPNDAYTEATPFTVGSTITRTFHAVTDQDWYELSLTAGTTYVLTLSMPGLPEPTAYYDFVLFEADGTTPFDATIGQYDIPGETIRLAYEPDTTGTYYLALLPDVDYPLLGEYTITFETPATGELELTVYDMFNELGAIDCYLMVTEVGGDPATDTIAEAVTAPNTAVTVTIPSTTTAWTGSGAYDVHVVLDMDSSGDSTPTDGDYVGINPVAVSGDTHAELLLDYLEPYFEPDSYEPDDSAATATAIAINGAAQTHNLSDGADLDYVSFVADGSSSYTVNTTSSGYMTFDLLDSGEMLLESHYLYGGPSSDSLGMLIAGTYYLEFYNGPQAYTVEVTSP